MHSVLYVKLTVNDDEDPIGLFALLKDKLASIVRQVVRVSDDLFDLGNCECLEVRDGQYLLYLVPFFILLDTAHNLGETMLI